MKGSKERVWKEYYRHTYPASWKVGVFEYGFSSYHVRLLELLAAKDGHSVLECGIGTGWPMGLAMAQRNARLHGIDIAESLIRDCRANFARERHTCCCVVGDIEALPYRDASFDLVYSFSTTWVLPNLHRALAEMVRVVKPGGRLVFDIINLLHPSQWLVYAYDKALNLARIVKRTLDGRPIDVCVVKYAARTPMLVGRALRQLGVSYSVSGFFVLLPLSLPIIGPKGDLCRYSPFFSFQLEDSPVLRWLGAKLVYLCQKSKETLT